MPLVCLTNVIYSVLRYFLGCAKALGVQEKAASITIYTSVALILPLSLIFAYWLDWGIFGLILGFVCGIAAQMVIIGWITSFSVDWQEVADEA